MVCDYVPYHKYGQHLCMIQEFSEIYSHYLNVVRKKYIKLTVLHTIMLILTELNFSFIQVITAGSCLETGVL